MKSEFIYTTTADCVVDPRWSELTRAVDREVCRQSEAGWDLASFSVSDNGSRAGIVFVWKRRRPTE